MSFVIYQPVATLTPYERGYHASYNDQPKSANPYDKKNNPKSYNDWLNGYADATADYQCILEDQYSF